MSLAIAVGIWIAVSAVAAPLVGSFLSGNRGADRFALPRAPAATPPKHP